MFRNIVSKLFKTWVAIVGMVSIVGFCWCTIVTLHDSYVAHKALSRAKDYFSKVNPSGDTWTQLQLIKDSQWLLTAQDVEDRFIVGCFIGAAHVFRSFRYEMPKDVTTRCRAAFNKLPEDYITTVGDQYVKDGCDFGIGGALKELNKVDQSNYFLPKIKECIIHSESKLEEHYKQKPKEFEAKTGITLSSYGAYIPALWGDSSFSNISYLLVVSLWLVVGGTIIVTSYGLKKWLIWLITK